jgi:hypothetical protein
MQLAFGALGVTQANDEWSGLKNALIQAIAVITPKELCWRLGIKATYLSDAIEGRDRKTLKAEWIPVILAMAPDSARAAILRELASPIGFDVVKRETLTVEQKLARLEQRVANEYGPSGARIVEENRR